jgi:riboflavin biosynthesis pyrimidine reductase
VLISRRFDVPWEAGLFAAADQPVLIYTSLEAGEAPSVASPVEIVRLEECTPAAALADLRARGVRALLSEGGPTLFHGFLEAGLVDELFLTLTALLTGDEAETPILRGGRLADPSRFALRWVLRAGDELFLRYASVR